MSIIVLRRAQCFFVPGEEAPESMVGGRMAPLHLFGRHRLRQWVLRCSQFELWTGPVNGRYAARLAEIAAGRNRGGREVGRLGGGPDQGEMEGRRKVWGG